MRLRAWPFSRLLPVTPETVSAFCFSASRLSIAVDGYAELTSKSCPPVASARGREVPATCRRFSHPVTFASVRDAEQALMKPLTCLFVYASMVSVTTPPDSVMVTTDSSPAVLRRRTVAPSKNGMPLPVELVKVFCLPASRIVSVDDDVKDVSAEAMAAAVSASEGASEAIVLTSESTESEIGEVAARRRRVVPFKSSVSAPAALPRAALRWLTRASTWEALQPVNWTSTSGAT